MTTNVEVSGKNNESNSSLLRRFSRRVKSSGILGRSRSLRFYSKVVSPNVRKKQKLRNLVKLDTIERLIKFGKAPDRRRKHEYVTDKED